MIFGDTIFALATAYAKSAIAVIRVSGPHASEVMTLFSSGIVLNPRTFVLTNLYDRFGSVIDEALVVFFPAPNSFTGEDVIELHVHGGKAILDLLLEELGMSFRHAEAGEFSMRAFINQKMNLPEVEGLVDLIDAETSTQRVLAMRQFSGINSTFYKDLRSGILSMLADVEAGIDFPEDVDEEIISRRNLALEDLKSNITKGLLKSKNLSKFRTGINVVILGSPNVGKSTLFNILVGRDAAIVTDVPGTTRDVLEAKIQIAGYSINLYDTAGIRESNDEVEVIGINRAKLALNDSDIVIFLSSFEDKNRFYMSNFVRSRCDKVIFVMGKCDNISDQYVTVDLDRYLAFSSYSDSGVQNLLYRIEEILRDDWNMNLDESSVVANFRHECCLRSALSNLERIDVNMPLELFAEELQYVLNEVEKIIGTITNEDVLTEIFSRFCVGK